MVYEMNHSETTLADQSPKGSISPSDQLYQKSHLRGETSEHHQMVFNHETPNDRERQILLFCETQQDKLNRALNKTYKEGKSIGKIDETQKRLKKLMPAKLAFAQIMRAIKKRDYMILNSDAVTEIDQIKQVVPEIVEFADDIREMR